MREKAHEAIVDEEVFLRVQKKGGNLQAETDGQAGNTNKRVCRSRHIFSGITKCRDCGRALVRGRRRREVLCCRFCTGKEEERIAIWELLNICRMKMVEQYGEKILGDDILEPFVLYQECFCRAGDRDDYGTKNNPKKRGKPVCDTEAVRIILQELFERVDVDCRGNVWVWWNFTGDEGWR